MLYISATDHARKLKFNSYVHLESIRPLIFINWFTDIFPEDFGTEREMKKIKYIIPT